MFNILKLKGVEFITDEFIAIAKDVGMEMHDIVYDIQEEIIDGIEHHRLVGKPRLSGEAPVAADPPPPEPEPPLAPAPEQMIAAVPGLEEEVPEIPTVTTKE